MKEHKFTWFREFLERRSGIIINVDKAYLVKSRLKPLLAKHNFPDLNALILNLKNRENSPLSSEVIDLMTTNETLFFRDQYPFEALQTLIFPEITKGKGPASPIRIWSAASSRGQEAFSIAITACESIPNAKQRVKIIGTDLSAESVAFANKSVYSKVEVLRGMSEQRLKNFFRPLAADWVVNDDLRRMAQFSVGNLISDNLVTQMRNSGPFDVVFLRNVLIYFGIEERKRVIDRIARTMNRGGYLLTGAADIIRGNQSTWEKIEFKGKRIWKLL